MPVQAHAMPDAMREVLVVGTVAGVDDHLARRSIDVFAWNAWFRRGERCVLRPALDLEDALHLVCRLAQYERAADVGGVALHFAAAVDQQDRPFANHLRLDRAVRQRGILPRLDTCAS